jgi:hypothetical protein
MPAERRYGMDHTHYAWSPLSKRERLEWPEQARVALCVVVSEASRTAGVQDPRAAA